MKNINITDEQKRIAQNAKSEGFYILKSIDKRKNQKMSIKAFHHGHQAPTMHYAIHDATIILLTINELLKCRRW